MSMPDGITGQPLSTAERLAIIESLTPEQRAELLKVAPDIAQAPPPAGSIGIASGEHVLEFTTPEAAGNVALVVDGERYRCSATAPVDALIAVLDAARTGDRMAMMTVVRPFLAMSMFPDARKRYEERCSGMAYKLDEHGAQVLEGGEPVVLPAIGIEAMIDHGLKLVEVYTGRPTEAPPSSGIGGASPATPSA